MANARQFIAEANTVFERAFHTGDAETIARMYTEDAELLIPEAPVFSGRDAIADAWTAIVGPGGNCIQLHSAEVCETEGWAYEVGEFTAAGANGDVLNAGKYIVIWKQQAAGDWRMHRDIVSWDISNVNIEPADDPRDAERRSLAL